MAYEATVPRSWTRVPVGRLVSTKVIGLCSQNIAAVSPSIALLSHTISLQLCCNTLTSIPDTIGHMRNLHSLSLARNQLTALPDTIGFLTQLRELRLNGNQLTRLPDTVGRLKKLTLLLLQDNQLTELPQSIGEMAALAVINVARNPLPVLPAQIGRLKQLRTLSVEGCPLRTDITPSRAPRAPPSLKEFAARVIVRNQLPILSRTPQPLRQYLLQSHQCATCQGPYFDTYVSRYKFMVRMTLHIPLEYRLCSPHWHTEAERIVSMFGPQPATQPPPQAVREALER
ncbi:hypothetical protein CXG81DRAFT_8816, partial [Caulochytrium protostelioides]